MLSFRRPFFGTRLLKYFKAGWCCIALANGIPQTFAQQTYTTNARQAILYDMTTHTVLFEQNARAPMIPSSMTKALLVYMVFQKLSEGQLNLSDTMIVSAKARGMGGSRMFLEQGSHVSVQDLLLGAIVTSGNDACVALAEGIWGSENHAASLSNQIAKTLGADTVHFVNVTGWPDPEHTCSAYDLLRVGISTIEQFPQLYARFYHQKTFKHNKIEQINRNPLLHLELGDGLKTGSTEAGGFGLLGSAMQTQKATAHAPALQRRLIFVINGLPSIQERAQEAKRLLAWGFQAFRAIALYEKTPIAYLKVPGHAAPGIPLWAEQETVMLSCPSNTTPEITLSLSPHADVYTPTGPAFPIEAGQQVATLHINVPGMPERLVPLVIQQAVHQPSWATRTWHSMRSAIANLFGAHTGQGCDLAFATDAPLVDVTFHTPT